MKLIINLDRICTNYNVGLTELAERAGMKQPNLSRIKRNRTCTLNSLQKIAKAVNETDLNRLIEQE